MLVDQFGNPIAKLQAAKPRISQARVGSGVPISNGEFDFEEAIELRTVEERHDTYRKMAECDAYIADSLRSNTLPLLSSKKWSAKPPRPPEDPKSLSPEEKEAQRNADFVSANLFNATTEEFGPEYWMRVGPMQRLADVLKMLTHGFSLFYKRRKVVNGKIVFSYLQWLEPRTVTEWLLDKNDNLTGVRRQYLDPDGEMQDQTLKIQDLALYVWDLAGARLEGVPLIRSMFGPWKRKDFLYRCKMIAMQRAGVGQPYAKRNPNEDGGDTQEDVSNEIERFLQGSFGPGLEHGYLSIPNETFEVGYLQQNPADLEKFDRMTGEENLSIAHAGMTRAGMQGETKYGGESAGETQQELMFVLVSAIAEMIAEQERFGVNMVQGLSNELMTVNFANSKQIPVIECQDINPNESIRDIPMLNASITAGTVIYRPQIEKMVLERLGFKLPDEFFEEDAVLKARELTQPPMMDDPEGGNAPGNGGKTGDAKEKASAKSRENSKNQAVKAAVARRVHLRMGVEDMIRSPGRMLPEEARSAELGRGPTQFEEATLALGVIRTAFTQGGQRLGAHARKSQAMMIEDFVARGRAGKVKRSALGGLRRSKPAKHAEMVRRMREGFLEVANLGRRHIGEELERQRQFARAAPIPQTNPVAFEAIKAQTGILPPGSMIPSDGPIFDVEMDVLVGELAEEAHVVANLTIDGLWGRLMGEGIAELARLQRAGHSDSEIWGSDGNPGLLEAFLLNLSDKPLDAAGRKAATVAYNQGRDVAIQEAASTGEALYVVRSEILDERTCKECKLLDGAVIEVGSPGYEALLPPAQCLGQEYCRGIYVPVSDEIVRAQQSQ